MLWKGLINSILEKGIMRNLSLIIFLFFALKIQGQTEFEAQKNFIKIKDILTTENSSKNLITKLNSLKLTFKDQINNNVYDFLNRDIDFGYNHKRIRVIFDIWQYQIDIITKNDSIYLKSIKTEYFKKYSYSSIDENELKGYLLKRNTFYQSHKMIKQLLQEISLNETFAMRCGDGLPYTKEGLKIKSFLDEEDIESLKILLSNFNCEKQAFAVEGFSMLSKNEVEIPNECNILIKHIIERNAELQICSGCITGLVEKIYE